MRNHGATKAVQAEGRLTRYAQETPTLEEVIEDMARGYERTNKHCDIEEVDDIDRTRCKGGRVPIR